MIATLTANFARESSRPTEKLVRRAQQVRSSIKPHVYLVQAKPHCVELATQLLAFATGVPSTIILKATLTAKFAEGSSRLTLKLVLSVQRVASSMARNVRRVQPTHQTVSAVTQLLAYVIRPSSVSMLIATLTQHLARAQYKRTEKLAHLALLLNTSMLEACSACSVRVTFKLTAQLVHPAPLVNTSMVKFVRPVV